MRAGLPRSLLLPPEQLSPAIAVHHLDGENRNLQRFSTEHAWAGTPAEPHAGWLVARSIRNHVLRVLSANGGYDLFVIAPGRQPSSERRGAYEEALAPASGRGTDGLFVAPGGDETDLWLDRSDTQRWGYARRRAA